MFESSRSSVLLDHFRIPYRVAAEMIEASGDGPHPAWVRLTPVATPSRSLSWPAFAADEPSVACHVAGLPVFGRLLDDDAVRRHLREVGGSWEKVDSVTDSAGVDVGGVWREVDGSVLLPFDPDETVVGYWSEAYHAVGGAGAAHRARRVAMRGYYRVRPMLPRRAQIGMRRAFTRVQARTRFPRWPVETGLHDFYGYLLRLLVRLAGESVPTIAAWPARYRWAVVLTHDVETAAGYENISLLRTVEEAAGYRSSWNFVPRRYEVGDEVVRELWGAGFEVGVHGLYHDGRDLESLETFRARLPEIQRYARRWGARGFRSPATHRRWELMPLLGLDYDSSYPDSDPFEPQAGGCCSWTPYFNDGLVELPITLPQDHLVFVILRRPDESLWLDKARRIREAGGMALLITHPDYMLDRSRLDAYARLLAAFGDDATAWRALPGDVSTWWRTRAASSIQRGATGWAIVGPAAEDARVEMIDAG